MYIFIVPLEIYNSMQRMETAYSVLIRSEWNCCRSLSLSTATSEYRRAPAGSTAVAARERQAPVATEDARCRSPFTCEHQRGSPVCTDDTVPWTWIQSPAHPRPPMRALAFLTVESNSQRASRQSTTRNCFSSFSLSASLELVGFIYFSILDKT